MNYTGQQVRLRPLRKSDIEVTVKWRNDPDLRENVLGYRFPVTQEMEEKWYLDALADQNQKRVLFAIETIQRAKLIGMIFLNKIDWIARLAQFGIIIGDKEFQGRKLAGDAMQLLFNYAFNFLNLRKIWLEVPVYNKRAIALYTKFGFYEEGKLRGQVFFDRRYHDLILMGLMAEEYLESHQQKQDSGIKDEL